MEELIAIPLAEYNHLKRCELEAKKNETFWLTETLNTQVAEKFDHMTDNRYSIVVYEQEKTPAGV